MSEILIKIYDILAELCRDVSNHNQYLANRMEELRQMIDGLLTEPLPKKEEK